MLKELNVSTQKRYQLIDITKEIEEFVKKNQVENGLVLVFVPHSTAAIILTENEQRLKQDWLLMLEKLVSDLKFEHNKIDNNADSHILSGILGQEKTLMIEGGKLIRGTWQQIFLVELDGPRQRRIIFKIIKDNLS